MKRIAILTILLLNPHSLTLYAQHNPAINQNNPNVPMGNQQHMTPNSVAPNQQRPVAPANSMPQNNRAAPAAQAPAPRNNGNATNALPNGATTNGNPALRQQNSASPHSNHPAAPNAQPTAQQANPAAAAKKGEKEIPLLSSVKDFLELDTLNKKILNENAYSYLFALTMPQADFVNIGQEITMINHGKYLQAMKQSREDLNINYVSFTDYLRARQELKVNLSASAQFINNQFSCSGFDGKDCYSDIVKNRVQVTRDINDNRVIYGRFLQAMEQPIYKAPSFNVQYPKLRYSELKKLAKLHLSDAVYLFEDGNVDQGLRTLLKAADLWKMILNDSQNLSDTLFASEQLVQLYHLVSNLLDQPKLKIALNNPHLTKILSPLTDRQANAIFQAIENDMAMNLRALSLINEKEVNLADSTLNYRRNANLNAYYFYNQMMLDNLRAGKPQNEVTPIFQAALKNLGLSKIEFFEYEPIAYQPIVNEFTNMISYHQLVRAKWEIMQKNITDIQRYITNNKAFGTNYHRAVITWNPRNKVLSTPSTTKKNGTIEVAIPSAK